MRSWTNSFKTFRFYLSLEFLIPLRPGTPEFKSSQLIWVRLDLKIRKPRSIQFTLNSHQYLKQKSYQNSLRTNKMSHPKFLPEIDVEKLEGLIHVTYPFPKIPNICQNSCLLGDPETGRTIDLGDSAFRARRGRESDPAPLLVI